MIIKTIRLYTHQHIIIKQALPLVPGWNGCTIPSSIIYYSKTRTSGKFRRRVRHKCRFMIFENDVFVNRTDFVSSFPFIQKCPTLQFLQECGTTWIHYDSTISLYFNKILRPLRSRSPWFYVACANLFTILKHLDKYKKEVILERYSSWQWLLRQLVHSRFDIM